MILRPSHQRAIELLATTDLRLVDVAEVLGVSRATIGRWLKQPAFAEELARRVASQPFLIEGLRVRTAHLALKLLSESLEGEGKPLAVKDLTSLLSCLMGRNLESIAPRPVTDAAAESPAEAPAQEERPLTPEEAERLLEEIDAEAHAEEEAARRAERRARSLPEEEAETVEDAC